MFGNRTTDGDQVCGLYFLQPNQNVLFGHTYHRQYLPLVTLSAHVTVLSSVARTQLTQTFFNPTTGPVCLRYTFPLYDGVSVVGFTCTINNDRVIQGVVQETQQARNTFNDAISRGETAGLFEQLPDASDVFTTTVGNVPAGAEIKVDIIVLGELKHDAEIDGVRYTLPTRIAPRYGALPGGLASSPLQHGPSGGIAIKVDVEMQADSAITSLISPSHPIGITIGSTSSALSAQETIAEPRPQLASATLFLATNFLHNDFVLEIKATHISSPVAILETHPTIPGQRALMTTLVPKFNLPSERPEIVFVCDQSGSMEGRKIMNLKTALRLFLKSLPVGVKFNICSFGDYHSFLFREGSRTYDADTLNIAMQAVDGIRANFGGTELFAPIQATFDKRDAQLDLEVFVLTDGQIWNQSQLFDMVDARQEETPGSSRVFTLGIGEGVSSALIEGLARAGNGFAQTVGDNEKLDKKVIRMLKAALTPHISDYILEIKYSRSESTSLENGQGEDFEMIDRVSDSTAEAVTSDRLASKDKTEVDDLGSDQGQPISLFDPSVDLDNLTEPPLDIPNVTIPRILQTPFRIPSLFPFNRTNVYLLLSPETAGNKPETVTLRATSKHGPLVLEIPVTTLTATSGETIHQLAARKAALELEEGRGWIFHAKHQSAPLKSAYPQHFHGMVQREAVRLGVQFQVGGKWCSFVAVENGNEISDVGSIPATKPMTAIPSKRADYSAMNLGNLAYASNLPLSEHPSDFSSVVEPTGQGYSPAAGVLGGPPTVFAPYTPPLSRDPPTGSSSFFGSSTMSAPLPLQLPFNGPMMGGGLGGGFQTTSAGGSLFGSASGSSSATNAGNRLFGSCDSEGFQEFGSLDAAHPVTSVGSSLFGGMPTATPSTDGGGKVFGSSHSADGSLLSIKPPLHEECKKRSPDLFGSSQAAHNLNKCGVSKLRQARLRSDRHSQTEERETLLETIVRLQSYEGSWNFTNELVAIIGSQKEKFIADGTTLSGDVWATVAVLVFMCKKLAAEKDAWELVAAKAMKWLDSQLSLNEHAFIEEMIETVGRGLH